MQIDNNFQAGKSPLQIAVERGNIYAVKILIEKKSADLDVRSPVKKYRFLIDIY